MPTPNADELMAAWGDTLPDLRAGRSDAGMAAQLAYIAGHAIETAAAMVPDGRQRWELERLLGDVLDAAGELRRATAAGELT